MCNQVSKDLVEGLCGNTLDPACPHTAEHVQRPETQTVPTELTLSYSVSHIQESIVPEKVLPVMGLCDLCEIQVVSCTQPAHFSTSPDAPVVITLPCVLLRVLQR